MNSPMDVFTTPEFGRNFVPGSIKEPHPIIAPSSIANTSFTPSFLFICTSIKTAHTMYVYFIAIFIPFL